MLWINSYVRFMIWGFIAVVSSRCSADETAKLNVVENTEVLNSASGALHARVKFTQFQKGDAYVMYWTAGEDETAAVFTPPVFYNPEQSISLFNLKEATDYNYRIIISAEYQPEIYESEVFSFSTPSIPVEVTGFYDETNNIIQETSDGYFLFHSMTRPGCLFLVNNRGKLVWYRLTTHAVKAARVTEKNTLLTLEDDLGSQFGDGNILMETTWGGDTLFFAKTGQGGLDKIMHHDVQLTTYGHFVAITNVMRNGLPGDGIIVLDRQGNKMWEWNSFDHLETDENYRQPWANSIAIDEDGDFIVSFRSLSQVWKISAQTGEVIWKLGKNGDIYPEDDEGILFQHFAHRDKDNNILLFDNGSDDRTSSRIVSFAIDEGSRTASRVINTFLPDEYFSSIMGSALLMSDDHLLAASAVNGSILKVDMAGNIKWKLKTADRIYRAEYVESPFGASF